MAFDKLTPAEEAAAARWGITDEVIDAAIAYWRLPGRGTCTDPDTLRSAAEVEVAAGRRIAAERAQAPPDKADLRI